MMKTRLHQIQMSVFFLPSWCLFVWLSTIHIIVHSLKMLQVIEKAENQRMQHLLSHLGVLFMYLLASFSICLPKVKLRGSALVVRLGTDSTLKPILKSSMFHR